MYFIANCREHKRDFLSLMICTTIMVIKSNSGPTICNYKKTLLLNISNG